MKTENVLAIQKRAIAIACNEKRPVRFLNMVVLPPSSDDGIPTLTIFDVARWPDPLELITEG